MFNELGSHAGRKLGLNERLAKAFGGGNSWVRSGWFDLIRLDFEDVAKLEEHLTQEIFFFSLFFASKENYGWLFDSPQVIMNFKCIYDRFLNWQNDPVGYDRDMKLHRTRIQPLWDGLATALDVESGRC